MNVLSIGGSNSRNSINKQLADYTAGLIKGGNVTLYDISAVELPLYSIDKENEQGIPSEVFDFAKKIDSADLIVLSLAEHNGSFNVGFKNLIDWTSRIENRQIFNNKPMLLMATSPGPRGGIRVLESAKNLFPYSGGIIKATFSLPEFYKNFDALKGITNNDIKQQLHNIIQDLNIYSMALN